MSLSSMELDRCANCDRETHDRDENKLCHDCRMKVCSHKSVDGWYCELVTAHLGPHRAFVDAPDEISWSNSRKILAEQERAEARVVAEHQADNVAVTVCAGAEIRMIAAIANDMEANGDSPDIHFFRDERGIRGLVLTGRLSRETTAGLRYEPVTGAE